jgi:hypothetical protein
MLSHWFRTQWCQLKQHQGRHCSKRDCRGAQGRNTPPSLSSLSHAYVLISRMQLQNSMHIMWLLDTMRCTCKLSRAHLLSDPTDWLLCWCSVLTEQGKAATAAVRAAGERCSRCLRLHWLTRSAPRSVRSQPQLHHQMKIAALEIERISLHKGMHDRLSVQGVPSAWIAVGIGRLTGLQALRLPKQMSNHIRQRSRTRKCWSHLHQERKPAPGTSAQSRCSRSASADQVINVCTLQSKCPTVCVCEPVLLLLIIILRWLAELCAFDHDCTTCNKDSENICNKRQSGRVWEQICRSLHSLHADLYMLSVECYAEMAVWSAQQACAVHCSGGRCGGSPEHMHAVCWLLVDHCQHAVDSAVFGEARRASPPAAAELPARL